MRHTRLLAGCFFLFPATCSFLLNCALLNAAEPSLNEIVTHLEQVEKEVQSASFSYTQDISYSLTGEKQSSSGTVLFQKPSRLRIVQKKPAEQVIVSNGKKVWVYTPAYHQVLVDSWKKWLKNSMVPSSLLNFGNTWSDLKNKYTFTRAGNEDGMAVLVMIPKNKDAWKLKFWIDGDSFIPVRTQLSGENVTITTKTVNYRKNPSIDSSTFTFTPPAGTETIILP